MRGGARSTSGPASQIGSQSMQRTASEWRRIPRRDGVGIDVPEWPIGAEPPTEAEWEMWEDHWLTKAQALIWEEESAQSTVAQYVRVYIASMKGRMSAQHGTLAKQLREELLLSPAAMRMHKIAIVGSEEADMLDSITGAKAVGPGTEVVSNPNEASAATSSAARFTVVKSA